MEITQAAATRLFEATNDVAMIIDVIVAEHEHDCVADDDVKRLGHRVSALVKAMQQAGIFTAKEVDALLNSSRELP